MIDEDEEFLRDLMRTFREDAEERIRLLSQAVVDLESAGDADAASAPLETLYRETHSLKGASAAVEQTLMVSLCQQLESVLAALKRREVDIDQPLVDTLSDTVDRLDDLLRGLPGSETGATELLDRLSSWVGPASDRTSPEPSKAQEPPESVQSEAAHPPVLSEETPQPGRPAEASAAADNVRVSTARLESIMLQAEEFIAVKLAAKRRSAALNSLGTRLDTWKRELYHARVSGDAYKVQEFLEWNSALVDGLLTDVKMLSRTASNEQHTVGPMVDELLDNMKRVLMLPVSSLLSSFPKMVRDLARNSGKEVDLVMTGAEIEIDKRIIENLKDPLVHILRNSVDHGIETPDTRRSSGKSDRGRITIAVSQLENNKIELCVSDDGAGVDTQQLRSVVEREGLRTQEQLRQMSDPELMRLAFSSGVSTSLGVSTVSGRGLGLAIVDDKVRQLGGSVTVESAPAKGTIFRLLVPATLATARGILAEVSGWSFVMPVVGVDRVMRVRPDEIRVVHDRETVQIDGYTVPLFHLREVLELPFKPQRNASDHMQVLVLGTVGQRIAFVVDRVLDEQEVLVKPLGPQLVHVRNVSGATVLGSGKVVPILSPADLVNSATARPAQDKVQIHAEDTGDKKSVLIAEDSITSRMLLKNILEAAGYYVRPTIDGQDALHALGEEEFDLVVSDIEMPRMNGIELTRKIREDQKLARIPVVLVTGLESQEDRERGLDAGANAYLTKSSFSQGTLLNTARSLL